MTDQIAYLNGTLLAADELAVSVFDQGFVMGVTVSERLRTFDGKLFRLVEHLRRLRESLEIVGLADAVSLPDLAIIAEQLVAHNRRAIDPADDMGVCVFVTPGVGARDEIGRPEITSCVYTYPLPFAKWFDDYERGSTLVVSPVAQIPAACWPPALKCRSRMHYFLADRHATGEIPGARALLLDEDGFVSEASTANVILYRTAEGIISPPRAKILPGISLTTVEQLANTLHIPFINRDIHPDELTTADEVLLCSTSPCVWPVTQVGSQLLNGGSPGPIAERLINAWSDMVGLDIRAQARAFATR